MSKIKLYIKNMLKLFKAKYSPEINAKNILSNLKTLVENERKIRSQMIRHKYNF